MPSLKVLEGSKNSEPELLHNSVETAAGSDGSSSSAKDPQQSQTVASGLVSSTNGSVKEQPASPLQQIVLIIEHKIRNLEKRKNKLESYKAIEKSGKKLTADQKNAVSKYDECLTSLDLARELCKQFQSIATVANKEAKKEAKRTAFVKAQQETAKVREVLVIQDVLRRLTEDDVRSDFRNGENGACKISTEDLTLLEKLHEETRPQRPKTTLQPTFAVSVKSAADHLSAVVDGRNKAYGDSTYVHLKDIISEVQDCGYFERDVETVDEVSEDQVAEETISTENDTIDAAEEATVDEVRAITDVAADPTAPDLEKREKDNPVTHLIQPSDPKSFGEAPAAAAVPTPSFPMHSHVIRQNPVPSPAIPVIVDNQNGPLIAPSIPIPAPVIASNAGIIPRNVAHVQSTATVVPPVPVTVPVIQPATVPLQPIAGQQIAATTVQAVEHAYFKQHYIQQQMRPIHEVIGTGNFFFLQESELDKPEVVSSPVPFPANVHHLATNPAPPSPANLQQPNQQLAPTPQPSPATSVQPQPPMISAQTTTFSNQPYQNMAAPTKVYNNPLHQQQPVEQSHPSGIVSMTHGAPLAPKPADIPVKPAHIPADINMQNVLPKQQPQEHVQLEHQSNQKNQLPQQKPSPFSTAGQQSATMNPIHEPNTQQFPTLMQSLHDPPHQLTSNHISQKLSNVMVDSMAEKLKTMNMTDKLAMNANHTSQQPKPRHDDWNSRGQNFASLAKTEDQWVTNTTQMNKPVDDSSQEKSSYNLSRQSQHQLLQQVTSSSSSSSNSGPVNSGTANRIQHNGNSASNYGMGNMSDTSSSQHGQSQQSLPSSSVQQLHQGGHRNPRGGAGGHQYNQNSGSNSRFSNDSGVNNPPTTFYKNNERFYQQNNNFGSNKSDSSYHQRGSMFKGRQDNGGSDASSMVGGYGSIAGSNASGGTNNNNNNNGNNNGSMDYRSNARPINSTRNTGPPSTRPQQRNHSGNSNYGGPRGSSNTRGQHTINA